MTEGAHKRLGFSAIGGREAKAVKIAAILAAAGRPLKPTDEVLDLGCGSGEIAEFLSKISKTVCSDVVDQRTTGRKLSFQLSTESLPFADASFDVVISNHVIEHTLRPNLHFDEIYRVLRPAGIAYLATPNRLWPWEVHAKLPFLHYLPWLLFSRLGIMLGRLSEPVRLVSLRQLRRLSAPRFSMEVWHHRVLKSPDRFALMVPTWAHLLRPRSPDVILQISTSIQPTLIVLLRRT
jgi:SAM-dependent methyltransferase